MFIYSVLVALLGISNVRAALPDIATRSAAVGENRAAFIRSTLAILDVPPTALCNGTFDFLMSITTFPVAGEDSEIAPETIEVTLSDGTVMNPTCITLLPAGESDERRAVLTIGDFTPEEGVGPIKVTTVGDLFLALPSGEQVNLRGEFFEKEPKNGAFLGQDKEFGPEFIDFAQEDPRDAFTDDNDCAAVFPDTTDVVQIIYQAGVREKNLTDIDGSAPLSPVGGTASAERANLMYSVGTSNVDGVLSGGEGIEILGIADSDSDNFVDICLSIHADFKSVSPSGKLFVKMECPETDDEAGIVFTVTGRACAAQVLELQVVSMSEISPLRAFLSDPSNYLPAPVSEDEPVNEPSSSLLSGFLRGFVA